MAAPVASTEASTPRVLLARRVARGHVADLMAENRREFRFRGHVRQQATVDVDIAAAGGERVHRVVIEHRELEVPVGQVAVLCHLGADHLDVVLQRLVFVETVGLDDLLVVPPGLLLSPCWVPITTFGRPVTGFVEQPVTASTASRAAVACLSMGRIMATTPCGRSTDECRRGPRA